MTENYSLTLKPGGTGDGNNFRSWSGVKLDFSGLKGDQTGMRFGRGREDEGS